MSPAARIALAVWAVSMWAGRADGQYDDIPIYIGQRACLECHAGQGAAGVCSLEAIPEHDRAYKALARPEAPHIATISGISQRPQQSRICLGCHATAADEGRRWTTETFDIRDGVQCEACHRAGSLHAARYRDAAGQQILEDWQSIVRSDRSMCADCHLPRASHQAVLTSGYRVEQTNTLYKTPVNLATSPDGSLLYVVCANSNTVIMLDAQSGELLRELAVGRRPQDIAVSPDGNRLYVTNRLSDSLSIIDSRNGQVIQEMAVGDEPHGVITDETGQFVYVLNTAENSLSVIDIQQVSERKKLLTGRGPWSIARHPDGSRLYMTSVWPEPVPFCEPARSEITVVDPANAGVVVDRLDVAEANMLEGIAFVPGDEAALFTLVRTKNLVPCTRLAQGWTITNGLGVIWPDGRVDQVLLDEPASAFPDPADVAVSPDGRYALISSAGADLVAVVDVSKLLELISTSSEADRTNILPNHLGSSRHFVVKRLATGSNPRGIVFSPDGRFAYVANALDDSVSVIDAESFEVSRNFSLGGPQEITELRRGEKLFHSARQTFGQQFSCRSCHPDGHINGLTFDIEADGIGMHPVDNRTLRGILDTAPFKWEGQNPTLDRQCGPRLAVFFTRLAPYTPSELQALVRYISTIERPPNRYRRPDGLTLAQRRGKLIFERRTTNGGRPIPEKQRCYTCHRGSYKTAGTLNDVGTTMWFDAPIDLVSVNIADLSEDVDQHGELGLYYFMDTGTPTRAFDTPHLTNIYDSAPYLHNGAAGTLEEIWTRFDVLTLHGYTRDLTREQLNDLIAYLKAL